MFCNDLPNIGGSNISPSYLIAPDNNASASIAAFKIDTSFAISFGDGVNATLQTLIWFGVITCFQLIPLHTLFEHEHKHVYLHHHHVNLTIF